MNNRRKATQTLEEEMANAGVPPSGDQVPPLEENVNDDQASFDPPLTDGSIRVALFQMSQSINTQAQAASAQAQAMTAQTNWKVLPRANQQVATMASRFRDFTRMNPPTFYGSKVEEDP
ncbi:hypothetical protein EJD97_002390, partial [Solanum chilense]